VQELLASTNLADEPELSPREVAVTFTDRHKTFVSEASRSLKSDRRSMSSALQ
jgi:hypothetical protein